MHGWVYWLMYGELLTNYETIIVQFMNFYYLHGVNAFYFFILIYY